MSVDVNMSIAVSWEDLRKLSPEQCDAFMRGVAACVSADPRCLQADEVEDEIHRNFNYRSPYSKLRGEVGI